MKKVTKDILLELYPEYVEIIGYEGISEIVDNPNKLKVSNDRDSGLPFELSVVFDSIGLAIKLIGAVINYLSFKSNENDSMDTIKLKIIDSLIPKMSDDQLKKALGSNSLEDIINAILENS